MSSRIGAVQIREMPQMQITVTVSRRVRFRLWMFRQILWLLGVVYPGQCVIGIHHGEDNEQ